MDVRAGEVLGLVGESGSGKTTVGMALMGYCRPGGKVTGGEILIDGRPLAAMAASELRRLRGGTVSYIPQDPGTALNPALRIGRQLSEMLEAHRSPDERGGPEGRASARRWRRWRCPTTDEFLRRYPHQLSGGQQQRVAIAMAFACRPHVIVCDEPTTGLDVTTQARVLETIRDLCHSHQVAALYVSHDLAVVAELADQRGGHVRRADRRARPARRDLRRPPPPLHAQAAARRPRPGGQARRGRDPRPRAAARQPAPPAASSRRAATWPSTACHEAFPPAHRVRGRPPGPLLPRAEDARRAADRPAPTQAPAEAGRRRARGRALERQLRLASHILHDIDLEVRRNECVALVGESGSGKTTLARCIAGLHSPVHGRHQAGRRPAAPRAPAGAPRRPASRSSTCSRTRTRR